MQLFQFLGSVLAVWLGGVALAYLAGRKIRNNLDHPLLDELLARYRGHLLLITIAACVADVTVLHFRFQYAMDDYYAPLVLALLLGNGLGVILGGFPLRRALFNESWSFAAFVSHQLRFYFGLLGFWLAVVLTPSLVYAAGSWHWVAAGAACGFLLVWWRYYQALLIRILRARLVEDPDLLASFEPIVARSSAAAPAVLESGDSAGGFCNAFALPTIGQPRVLFGRRLLDLIEVDEAAAIFAHEVAHLEQFDAARLRQHQRREWTLVAIASFAVPVVNLIAPESTQFVLWAWPVLILLLGFMRQRNHQVLEVGGDTRAVELCRDPEALIRGLTKLHDANHAPRRLAHEVESQSSHPSLARRIQSIRQHAKQLKLTDDAVESSPPVPELEEAWCEVFAVADNAHERLVFEPERIYWITLPEPDAESAEEPASEPASAEQLCARAESFRMDRYAGLVELRLMLQRKGPVLRAVDTNRKVTETRLQQEDAGRVKRCLDLVDIKLASLSEVNTFSGGTARLAGCTVGLVAFLAHGEELLGIGVCFWALIAALGALSAPHRSWLAAAGAIGVVTAGARLLFAENSSGWSSQAWLMLSVMLAAGLWCLYAILVRLKKNPERFALVNGKPEAVALGFLIPGGLLLGLHLLTFVDGAVLPRLYTLSFHSQGLFTPLIAGAAALALVESPRARVLAVFLGVIGLCPIFFGSNYFLTQILGDPLMADVPVIAMTDAPLEVRHDTHVDGAMWNVQLSPTGKRFLGESAHDHHGGAHLHTYVIGAFSTERSRLNALQAAFLDDNRLLALVEAEEGVELRSCSCLDPKEIGWRLPLPGIDATSDLTLRTNGSRWQVVSGSNRELTMSLTGTVGADRFERVVWNLEPQQHHRLFVGLTPNALQVVWGGGKQGERRSLQRVLSIFDAYNETVEFRLVQTDGAQRELARTLSWVHCQGPPPGSELVMLSAHGGGQSNFWSVSLDTGELTPLFRRAGGYFNSDWNGQHLTLLTGEGLLFIDPFTKSGSQVRLPVTVDWETSVSVRGEQAAVASVDARNGRTRVLLLALPR